VDLADFAAVAAAWGGWATCAGPSAPAAAVASHSARHSRARSVWGTSFHPDLPVACVARAVGARGSQGTGTAALPAGRRYVASCNARARASGACARWPAQIRSRHRRQRSAALARRTDGCWLPGEWPATWSAGGWCRSVLGGPRRRGAMTGFDLVERDFHLDECLRHRTRGPCLSSVIRGRDADARRRPAAACTRCLVGRGSRSIDGQEDCTACQRGQGHECRQFAADERQSAGHFASLRRGLTSNGRTGGAAKNRRHANAACVLLRSEPGQPGVPWPV